MDFFLLYFSLVTLLERRKRDEKHTDKTISLAILTLLSFNTFVYASIGEPVDIAEEYSIFYYL